MVRPTLLDLRLSTFPDLKVLVLCNCLWFRVAYLVTGTVRRAILARPDFAAWLELNPTRTNIVQFHRCGRVHLYSNNKIFFFQAVFADTNILDTGWPYVRTTLQFQPAINVVDPVRQAGLVHRLSPPLLDFRYLAASQQRAINLREPQPLPRHARAFAPLHRGVIHLLPAPRHHHQRVPFIIRPATPDRDEAATLSSTPPQPADHTLWADPVLPDNTADAVLGTWLDLPPGFEPVSQRRGSFSNPYIFVDASSSHALPEVFAPTAARRDT